MALPCKVVMMPSGGACMVQEISNSAGTAQGLYAGARAQPSCVPKFLRTQVVKILCKSAACCQLLSAAGAEAVLGSVCKRSAGAAGSSNSNCSSLANAEGPPAQVRREEG